MPTLGVRVDTTLATDKQKVPVASLYKGFRVSGVRTELNKVLTPRDTITVDLSASTFLCLMVEAFSQQSNAVDVTVNVDAQSIEDPETGDDFLVEPTQVTYKNTTMLVLEASNLNAVTVVNANESADAVLTLIY